VGFSFSQMLEHVVEVAVGPTKAMRTLSKYGCHGQQHSGADGEKADTG
jgi:hypothetical protein